jgi:hypothetical protein
MFDFIRKRFKIFQHFKNIEENLNGVNYGILGSISLW